VTSTGYILPLDAFQNPDAPEYAGDGSVGYVFKKEQRGRPTRLVLSSGEMGSAWDIGTVHRLEHDQTQATLGTYTVVGIIHYDEDGLAMYDEGEVPDRKIATAVFK
jgi:hypothetical protein